MDLGVQIAILAISFAAIARSAFELHKRSVKKAKLKELERLV